MSYVLIDNSTLTSVQRLLGEIQINNKNIIDGDILAVENLIQAILFYDNIIAIDDYIEKYKEDRKKRFDFIRFISPKELVFDNLQTEAQKEAKQYQPEIMGGEFTDSDFKVLLDSLHLNIVTTWDISGSEYYLNLKLLGYKYDENYDKYNQIGSAIFGDFDYSEKLNYQCSLVDSQGNKIQKGYKVPDAKWSNNGQTGESLLSRQLWRFIASLNWIAYKSIYYSHVAKYLKADLCLHPIRQAFGVHYMNKTMNMPDGLVASLLQSLKIQSLDTVKIIKQSTLPSLQELKMPFFAFYLASKVMDSRHIIEKAYDIRKQQCFVDARDQLAELNNLLYEENDLKKFSVKSQKIKNSISKTMDKIKSYYGLPTQQGILLNNVIKITNTCFTTMGIQLPDIFGDTRIRLPEFLQVKPKGLNFIYKDITEDLAQVAKFGKYHELLTANVDLVSKSNSENERYDFEFKCEDPRYRYRSSDFKSPM